MLKLTALLALCLPLATAAAIYRWVDASGTVHFASAPPAQGHYRKVDPTVAPPSSAPGITGINEFRHRYQARRARQDKAEQARLKAKARHEALCAKARQRISELENATARRLWVPLPNGQRARMTQPEFEKRLDQARSVARSNCVN